MQEVRLPPSPVQRFPGELEVRLSRDTLGTLTRVARECKDVAHMRLGGNEVFLLCSAETVKEGLIAHHRDFIKTDSSRTNKSLQGAGLGTSEGDFHHRHRRALQGAFHQDMISSYAGVVVDYSRRMRDVWTEGRIVNMTEEMTRLTLPIIVRLLFGIDLKGGSEEEASWVSFDALRGYTTSRIGPLSRLFRTTADVSASKEAVDRVIFRAIKERREGRSEQDDILSMLVRMGGEDGGDALSDQQVRDEVLTLFAAANATTGKAMAWTWYLLSQNPDAEERLHSELDTVLDGRPPTADDYPRLQYVTQLLTESMRLYPPTWLIGRKAAEDTTVGGFSIPAGSIILMSQYILHHDPRYYSEPERFLPERWTSSFKDTLPKLAYFPFGAGPRSCIGEPLAWLEGVLAIAVLAQSWRPRHVSTDSVELKAGFSIPPKYVSSRPFNPRYGFNTTFYNPRYVISGGLGTKRGLRMRLEKRKT